MKYGKWNDTEILFPNRIPFHMNPEKHGLKTKLKSSNMMNYIINKNGPILFPSDVPHETFAPVVGEILAFGFCVIWFSNESNRFQCFTLPETSAKQKDYEIIENFLNDKK